MVRSARSYRQEARRLREDGWTYQRIAAGWVQRYGFNPRVASRLAHGLTQAEVADKWNALWPDLHSPKTAKHISYWEIWPAPGGRAPSLDTLNRLALIFQCHADDLLGGEDYTHLDPASGSTASAPETPADADPVPAHSRYRESESAARSPHIEVLRVAIAVVVDETHVLLVRRRQGPSELTWQFPAGVIKPGTEPAAIAVSETLAETGIHCAVTRALGSRLHPVTGTSCEYFLCSPLAGAVENKDVVENMTAIWVERDQVGNFVPERHIFPPALQALRDQRAANSQ